MGGLGRPRSNGMPGRGLGENRMGVGASEERRLPTLGRIPRRPMPLHDGRVTPGDQRPGGPRTHVGVGPSAGSPPEINDRVAPGPTLGSPAAATDPRAPPLLSLPLPLPLPFPSLPPPSPPSPFPLPLPHLSLGVRRAIFFPRWAVWSRRWASRRPRWTGGDIPWSAVAVGSRHVRPPLGSITCWTTSGSPLGYRWAPLRRRRASPAHGSIGADVGVSGGPSGAVAMSPAPYPAVDPPSPGRRGRGEVGPCGVGHPRRRRWGVGGRRRGPEGVRRGPEGVPRGGGGGGEGGWLGPSVQWFQRCTTLSGHFVVTFEYRWYTTVSSGVGLYRRRGSGPAAAGRPAAGS